MNSRRATAVVFAAAAAVAALASFGVPWWRNRVFRTLDRAAVAAVKNPHGDHGEQICQVCHVAGDASVGQPNGVCSPCHQAHADHPLGIKQATAAAPALPTATGGEIVCHTCHEPHDIRGHRFGLRMEYAALCKSCHRNH